MRRRLISEHIQSYPFHPSLYTVTDPSGPSGGPIDQSVVSRLLEQDQIWAERGKAIQSYALLEQSLNMLFSQLSDTTESVAGTIFYKISNASARNSIIEKLLKTKYNAKFNLFWNSYLKLLRPIDLRRNEIVHWVAALSPPAPVRIIPHLVAGRELMLLLHKDRARKACGIFRLNVALHQDTGRSASF